MVGNSSTTSHGSDEDKIGSHSHPSKKIKKLNKYKGVRMRRWGSWVSEIRMPHHSKTRIWLGSYSTAEAAARAYDAALLCLKGAAVNFPFLATAYSIHVPPLNDTVLSPKSIKRIAAAAANRITTFEHHQHHESHLSPSLSSEYDDDTSDNSVADRITTYEHQHHLSHLSPSLSSQQHDETSDFYAAWFDLDAFQLPVDPLLSGSAFCNSTTTFDDFFEAFEIGL